MLVFSAEQFDGLSQVAFFRNLEERIKVVEGKPVKLSPEQRVTLWAAAEDGARHGLRTIGACLVLCHLYWELGTDCFERLPAMAAILADAQASEIEKLEALWSVRTALFVALQGE